MDALLQDLRYALRTFHHTPGFALVAVLTLALGIGVTTAIFSVVNGVLLRPLPYHDPDRVVSILGYNTEEGLERGTVSYPDIYDLRRLNTVFTGVAAYDDWMPTLIGEGPAERFEGASVSANYFSVLGIEPAVGRFFLPDEETPGSSDALVISHRIWTSRYGGDPGVIGRRVQLSGNRYTIVGVSPADLENPDLPTSSAQGPDFWRVSPAYFDPETTGRGARSYSAIARLKPGISQEQAQAELNTLMQRLAAAYPETNAKQRALLVGLKERLVAAVRPALLMLWAAAGLVLLIACANVANLLLVRASTRSREMSVRMALGASGGRILRQLLTESLVLAGVGGGLGVALAFFATDVLVALGGADLPRADQIEVDARVLAFAGLVSLLTGVLFGLAPAFRTATLDVHAALKEDGRAATSGRRQRGLREALVAGEIALAVVLSIGAGLLLRSFWSLQSVDAGVRAAGVLTLEITPSFERYSEHAQVTVLYRELEERLSAIPGVEAVGSIDRLPMTSNFNSFGFTIDDRPPPAAGEEFSAQTRAVSPGYFRALDIPIRRGRGFSERDEPEAPAVVLINEAMARRFWPGEDPVGQRITVMDASREVVGIVGDVRQSTLGEAPLPSMYLPHSQTPALWMRVPSALVLRTSSDPLLLVSPVRRAMNSIDPTIPVSNVRTMERIISETLTQPRFRSVLVGLFATLALLLGAVGIYGVVAFAVAQRSHELGVRMALGARSQDITRLVVRQGILPVGLGIALGMGAAVGVGRAISHLLFGVSASDPLTYVAVPTLLAVIALLASYLPARRAARVDPMVALRAE